MAKKNIHHGDTETRRAIPSSFIFSVPPCLRGSIPSVLFFCWPLILFACFSGCEGDSGKPAVVVYSSLDEHYSKPILQEFEKQTGIRVLDLYDTEADKTTGLYLRILAEMARPRADVFWNSEVLRTVQLAEKGALAVFRPEAAAGIPAAFRDPGGRWTGFAARARVLIYNTDLVTASQAPRSVADLADPRFKDRACIAVPLFGTTATHAGALRAVLGKEGMEDLFRRFKANGVRAVSGNSMVRDLVASGDLALGITDTDDAHEALAAGKHVALVFPDQETPWPGLGHPLGTLLIPNTASLVRGGPNPESGKRLIEYLLSSEVEERLARSGSVQIPLRQGLAPPPGLPIPTPFRILEVDASSAARGLAEAEPFLEEMYLR
jgi:iron(III) transport system substrate-binding protein